MVFDPDQFLSQEQPVPSIDGFDPDKFVAGEPQPVAETAVPAPTSIPVPGTEYSMPIQAPVVNPAGPGIMSQLAETPVGQVAQNIGKVAQPYATAASKLMGEYAAKPIAKLAPDLAAVSMGVPPPNATAKLIGATEGAYNVARGLPTAPSVATATVPITAQQAAANPMLAAMQQAQTESAINRTLVQKIAMSKVMQTIGPALNTAARVAGPAGLAYNAYEAGQMARQTGLGERLAQGQAQRAESAFRNMNVPYGSGFTQGISQQQAQNILASGSPRDIQAFGGTDFLRKKALGI